MSSFPPEVVRIDVGGAELGVLRWHTHPGAPVVFAVHGFTGNAWSWSAVARHLDGRVGLVAIDLRGRGLSHDVDGPFGTRQHADDVAAVVRRLNASPAIVTGHGLGAFVALATSERHPGDVADVVLVDGGAPISMADHADPHRRLDQLLGPALNGLGQVWTDRVTYRARWADHPAFGDLMTPEFERYALSDLVEFDGGIRTQISETGVRTDGEELLVDPELRTMLERRQGTRIVVAETGLDAAPPPLVGDDAIAALAQHRWRRIPDTNHYSILFGEAGASAVAEELLACVGSDVTHRA